MKIFKDSLTLKKLIGSITFLSALSSLNACSSMPFPGNQPQLATQTQELEKLKSAEYQDDVSAMSFEDGDQKLGNYYAAKGLQVHRLIDQMEKGQPASDAEITQALDTSAADKYDDRPPVPLDDEIGNGY